MFLNTMLSQLQLFYSLAAMSYVMSCLFFAAVRYFHVCIPYVDNKDYYYPARKAISLFYLIPVVLLIYAWHPSDPEAWQLVKNYYPLTHFFYCSVLLYFFFDSITRWGNWHRIANALAIAALGSVALMFLASIIPGFNYSKSLLNATWWTTIVVGVATMTFSVVTALHVKHWFTQVINDNFSNTDDMLVPYAKKVIWVPVFIGALSWVLFFADSQLVLAIVQCLLVVFNIWLLILILPSYKHQQSPATQEIVTEHSGTPQPTIPDDTGSDNTDSIPLDETTTRILNEIKATVEGEKLYLKPHLTIQDVTERCSYGRTYISRVFKEQLGGFYLYVNTLRMKHATAYKQQHPLATQDEVATESGFTSRQALSNAKRRMEINKNA